MTAGVIIAIIITAIVALVIGFFIGSSRREYGDIAEIVKMSADFDFTADADLEYLAGKSGNIGYLAGNVLKLNKNLKAFAADVDTACEGIASNVTRLSDTTGRLSQGSDDNSSTAQQLAAAMQETAASTQTMSEAMQNVKNDAEDIEKVTADGLIVTKEIQNKAQNLELQVAKMRSDTDELYADVKKRSEEALAQSKAVEKINDMANAIMDIASQTSLLALNASIEAARAGEGGRGFAVVAEEIGKLAGQSSETVSGISGIVKDVHNAVDNMSECLETLNEFLDKKVAKDYDQFIDVSQQYNNDAHVFQVSLQDIHYLVENLTGTVDDVANNLEGINATVGESAEGITDIAHKTTDMVEYSSQSNKLVGESAAACDRLSSLTGRFRVK